MDPAQLLGRLAKGPVPTQPDLEPTIERLRQERLGITEAEGHWSLQDPAGWGPHTLAWRAGRPVELHATLDSTNTRARRLLSQGGPLPLIVADHQTAGRGRLGRVWEALPGQSLLFSLCLRPQVALHHAPRCVLLWAAAMAEVLDLYLKWPNDLVSESGAKVGGVLAELENQVGQAPVIILGVGINLYQHQFDGLPNATSLARLGRPPADRALLFGTLVQAIERVQVHDTLDRWRARAHTLGRHVRVEGVEGIAESIREDGALIVGGIPVLAGDVELIAPVQNGPG